MRDAALALLTCRAILESAAQHFSPASHRAHHLEAALAHLTACIAFTRATSLAAMRGKARLLLTHLPHGSAERALAISLLRDLERFERRDSPAEDVSKLT